MKRILLVLLVLFFSLNSSASEDWLINYYKSPTPGSFVEEVNDLSKSGMLSNPKRKQAVSVFLSRVLAANPDKTLKWMKELDHLNKSDMKTVTYAVWISDTKESKEYLKSIEATKALETKPTDLLQVPIDSPYVLDALWTYFFATGQKEPIRRIVSAFNYGEYSGSLKSYKSSNKTEKDKKNALLDSLFMAARWSLESNIRQHPRVGEICGDIFNDKSLTNNEQLWLAAVLSKALPEKYNITIPKPGQSTVQSGN